MGISEEEIAICKRLRMFASEDGEVNQKDMRKILGAHAAGLVEEKLGSGPWQMNQLEQFIHNEDILSTPQVAGTSATSEDPAIDASASDAPGDDASEESRGPSEWRTKELIGLHALLDGVLRKTENEDAGDFKGTIEEAAEFDAMKIQRGIMHHVVMPLRGSPMNPSGGAEVLWKARMQQLPRVVNELSSLLQKSLRLTRLYGLQHQQITMRQIRLKQEIAQLERQKKIEAEDKAQHDEQLQTMLDATIERLTTARQNVQEKEKELAELRQHVDLLFSERALKDELLQKLEAQIQSAEIQQTARRSPSPEENEMALAAQGSNRDLRRRLSTAELALDDAREASASKDRRIAELETRLKEIENRPGSCMRRSHSALEALGGTHTPRADHTGDAALQIFERRRSPTGSPLTVLSAPMPRSLTVTEESVKRDFVGEHKAEFFDMAAADAEDEKPTAQTGAHRGKKKRVSTGGNALGKGSKTTAGVGAMPGDLRSLGRMLSVSDSIGNPLDGLFGKKK